MAAVTTSLCNGRRRRIRLQIRKPEVMTGSQSEATFGAYNHTMTLHYAMARNE